MTPTIRVFVPTFRRPHLLRRALRSLLAQTYPSWVAEVRNDDPTDHSPEEVARECNDPRIRYIQHRTNLGGVALFNAVFSSDTEPYVSLLEDDNWWQPAFLQRMLSALEAHPEVTLAWSNQQVWEETAAGDWRDTGRLVRPAAVDLAPVLIPWPQSTQCLGALHANGAMLLRTRRGVGYAIPRMEFGGTEAVRERMLPHPLLYVPEPLAVFSVTRATHRSREPAAWATLQVLLAATFFKHAPATPAFWHELWQRARHQSPRMTGPLILAALQDPALRSQLKHSTAGDWRHLAIRSLRRPTVFLKLWRARQREPELWNFLAEHTARRTAENSGRIADGGTRLGLEKS